MYQNGNGNGSWFYRAAGTAGTPGTPAVEGTPAVPGTPETTRVEYRWDVYAFHYEYRWSVYERGIIEGTAPVTCDIDGPIDGPIDEPIDEPTGTPETPTDELTTPQTPQTPQTPDTTTPVAHVLAAHTPKQHRAAAAVPTTIDAGL